MWFTVTTNPGLITYKDGQKNKNGIKSIKIIFNNSIQKECACETPKIVHKPQGSKEHGLNTTNLQWHTFVFVKMLDLATLAVRIFITIQMITLSVCIILQTKCTISSLQFSTFQFLKLAKVAGTHNLN
jgi:hypothetical protein